MLPAVAGLALLGAACFNEPVTAPDHSKVDARLLGAWDCRPSDETSDDRALLTILAFDAAQYYAEWKESEKVERYRGYPGTLKGHAILNVQDLSDKSWTAVRTSISADGSLSLVVPSTRITDLTNDAVRLRTLRHEADQASAWQAFAICVPHKAEEHLGGI
jgi:hypothetical protein